MKPKTSLAAIVLGVSLSAPAQALIDDSDLNVDYAHGSCLYHGYVLEISCDLSKPEHTDRCQIGHIYTPKGKEVTYPESLPTPKVVLQPPKILYCIDPPEKKKDDKKPFLCC